MCDSDLDCEIHPVDVASSDTSVVLNDENSATTVFEELEEICCEDFGNATKSAINVQNSSEVVIGPVTQFHGPVTIYQNINGTGIDRGLKKSIENGLGDNVKESKVEFKSEEKSSIKKFCLNYKSRMVYFGIASLFVVVIGVVAIVIHKNMPLRDDFEVTEDDDGNIKKIGKHRVIYRKEWGGRDPLYTEPMNNLPKFVIISHTAGKFCEKPYTCSSEMQGIQTYHVTKFGSPDIGYNFLIGGDGNIYVGRGWDVQNFQSRNTIGISFMGNFAVYNELTEDMNEAGKKLLSKGAEIGKLDPDYKVVCHNQTYNTISPGENVYKKVIKWPHYYPDIVTIN